MESIIRSNRWLNTPIDRIDREDYIFGYWFPTYKKYIPYRIRILKLALKDLERIKEEVRIDRLRDDANKRILKCQEGKNIWYRLWINPEDMMRIEPLLEGGMYYLFFYEIRNNRRVLGKLRRYWIFFYRMNARDVRFLASLCLGMPLTCV